MFWNLGWHKVLHFGVIDNLPILLAIKPDRYESRFGDACLTDFVEDCLFIIDVILLFFFSVKPLSQTWDVDTIFSMLQREYKSSKSSLLFPCLASIPQHYKYLTCEIDSEVSLVQKYMCYCWLIAHAPLESKRSIF